MTLEELLDSMPSPIIKDGNFYHFFIAKGTRGEDNWVVGYSDYESELTNPIEDKNLGLAVAFLQLKVQEVINEDNNLPR